MKRNNKTGVSMDPMHLLNEVIWPATRYCIGRHSYVSLYAKGYWDVIRTNRNKFSEDRLQFYARDVKDCIANTMCFWKNVRCENTGNDRIVYDPYYLLTRFLYHNPNCKFNETDFELDCITGQVSIFPRNKPLSDLEMAFATLPDCDLAEWSKLASCIVDSKEVTLVSGEKYKVIETYDFICYEDGHKQWIKEYTPVDWWNAHIPQELIARE